MAKRKAQENSNGDNLYGYDKAYQLLATYLTSLSPDTFAGDSGTPDYTEVTLSDQSPSSFNQTYIRQSTGFTLDGGTTTLGADGTPGGSADASFNENNIYYYYVASTGPNPNSRMLIWSEISNNWVVVFDSSGANFTEGNIFDDQALNSNNISDDVVTGARITGDSRLIPKPGPNIVYGESGPAEEYTVTLSPFNDNIIVPTTFADTPDPVYYTLGGDLAGATRTGAPGASYAFNTTITLEEGYQWKVQPNVTNPTGFIPSNNTSVAQTITGEIQEIPTGPDEYTVTLSPFNDNIIVPSTFAGTPDEPYTLSGDLAGATRTGAPGASYAFNTTITLEEGYEWKVLPNITNPSGFIPSNNTSVAQTITGEIQEIPEIPSGPNVGIYDVTTDYFFYKVNDETFKATDNPSPIEVSNDTYTINVVNNTVDGSYVG